MAKNIQDILSSLPRKDRQAIRARAAQLIQEELTLQQLRKAREQSQQELAKKLGVKQAEVSRLERRTDMYLSTLRSYIEAMGGRLEITATFPDRKAVRITNFGQEASP
jgi:DNA-directed RNA polymerase specialized sigma subunit